MIALLATLAVSAAQASGCLAMGPHDLDGRLVRHTFAGPPNYESVKAGDQPETYWLLQLDRPVCVTGADDPAAARRLTEIQLILTAEQFRADRGLVGRRVHASGIFMSALSGHHHTAVLLRDARLAPAR